MILLHLNSNKEPKFPGFAADAKAIVTGINLE